MRTEKEPPIRSVAYLSGAPRVSTRPEAAATGPRAHVLGVIHALKRSGWEVIPYIVGDRVPVKWVQKESRALFGGREYRRWFADGMRIMLGLYHMLKVRGEVGSVSWVYERMGLFQALGWPFRRTGIPWVLEVNARFSLEKRGEKTYGSQKLVERWESWVLRQASLLVVVSDVLRDLLLKMDIPEEKILVLPNAVDVHLYNPENVEPKRVFSQPTIGFVGTMYPWQGLDRLIDAISRIRRKGIHYALVVVGDGPMRETWEALARDQLGDRVYFAGRVGWEEVPAWIAGMDLTYSGQIPVRNGVQVYQSPLKLYEYMAMGRVPIVSCEVPEVRYLIQDGDNGYIVDPRDSEGLVNVLQRAWEDRERWREMGKRARKKVEEAHSWDVRVQRLIQHVEPLLVAKKKYR